MTRMLDVSEDVRAEIGDEEAERLLSGDGAPGSYDCTSCRTPGDSRSERTSTVLFVGGETAVLAFAHAGCVPSQVVAVAEEQLRGAVASITATDGEPEARPEAPAPTPPTPPAVLAPDPVAEAPRQAVLGVTCGLVLCGDDLKAALVVEPTGPVTRPGSAGMGDDFLPLLIEQGFLPVLDVDRPPATVPGWSVLLVSGRLHAVMQPGRGGEGATAWWQAHQPLQVTDGWRQVAVASREVLVFAAPVGSVGRQPREDLLRDALELAASRGLLVGSTMPLTGA
ncbi:hypothetical protein SRB5_33040 [Streptomyces sp. RB5]|uniref:Uncharacterized protein n=1 Tax=Streptomyces smaragdinus TaxID=2585196 RepID=A0A7K0CI49_9ACTN|nr:hypothetical protein [Streptomyces smaragdinus]MQY13161.1 hypothetical protein [Streptomyces smaragdinus]